MKDINLENDFGIFKELKYELLKQNYWIHLKLILTTILYVLYINIAPI